MFHIVSYIKWNSKEAPWHLIKFQSYYESIFSINLKCDTFCEEDCV